MADLPALIVAITGLIAAIGTLVAVLRGQSVAKAAQAATAVKVDAIHAATVTDATPITVTEVKP